MTVFSRLYFSNPDINYFENARITIPCKSIIEVLEKELIEIMIRSNEICNDNITYTVSVKTQKKKKRDS